MIPFACRPARAVSRQPACSCYPHRAKLTSYAVEQLPRKRLNLVKAERLVLVGLEKVKHGAPEELGHEARVLAEHEVALEVDALAVGVEVEVAARRTRVSGSEQDGSEGRAGLTTSARARLGCRLRRSP